MGTVGISLNKEEEVAVANLLGVPVGEGFKAQLLGKKLKAFIVKVARETEEPVKQVDTGEAVGFGAGRIEVPGVSQV